MAYELEARAEFHLIDIKKLYFPDNYRLATGFAKSSNSYCIKVPELKDARLCHGVPLTAATESDLLGHII